MKGSKMNKRKFVLLAASMLVSLFLSLWLVFKGQAQAPEAPRSSSGVSLNIGSPGSPLISYTISGKVVDADANPVPGVIVTDGGSPANTATTAANGVYILTTSTGSYTVTAARNGDACLNTGWTNPIVLPPNKTNINFTCTNYTIAGTVLDAAANPVPGVIVTDGGSPAHTATTAANGTYILTTWAGSYTVTAARNGDACPKTVAWTNPVVLPPNKTNINFICPNYTIAGTVLDAAANPVPGVIVTDNALPAHTATTAANGTYTLTTWAGSYTISAAKNGDTCLKTGWATPVVLPPNKTNINFTCPVYTISGSVMIRGAPTIPDSWGDRVHQRRSRCGHHCRRQLHDPGPDRRKLRRECRKAGPAGRSGQSSPDPGASQPAGQFYRHLSDLPAGRPERLAGELLR